MCHFPAIFIFYSFNCYNFLSSFFNFFFVPFLYVLLPGTGCVCLCLIADLGVDVMVFFSVRLTRRALTIKHRRTLCGPMTEGYESRALPGDYKEDHDNRRNQQVYSASPVKTVDKGNESGKAKNFF